MPTTHDDLLFLLEKPTETMRCKAPGAFYLVSNDLTPLPRRNAKQFPCGTELPSSSNARLVVACKRHAFSSNLRICVFGLGMRPK